jgi:hypothetical protein
VTPETAPAEARAERGTADLAACQRRLDEIHHEIYWRGYSSCTALCEERARLWRQAVQLETALAREEAANVE